MNKQEATNLIAVISASFPDVKVNDMTIRSYYENLKDLEYELACIAVKQLISTSAYFPRIASIREKYFELSNPKKTSADAIALINKAISDFGRYESIKAMDFLREEDKALYEVVKAIGFNNICNSNINNYRTEIELLHKETDKANRENMQLSGELKSRIAKLSGKMRVAALMLENTEGN